MPLLKPATMSDILSTPQLSGLSEGKVQISFASSHHSLDSNNSKQSRINVDGRSLPERIPAFGLLMAFLSVFCFSIASVIVRFETTLPAIQILVIRSSFQFVTYFITTLIYRYSFFGQAGHRIDLMLRSFSGTIALSAVYVSYRLIPLSDASTIHFASPVFVTVFAYFLLKEPFTKLQIITGTITLTGVIIIAKPEFLFGAESATIHEMRFEGTMLAVLASMVAAFSMITLRKLKTTPVSVVVMWFSSSLIIFGSLYLTIAQKWTMPTETRTWRNMVIVGICGIFDQYLITLAFQYEKAGPISVVRTFNIVLSFLWEVLLLGEQIQLTSVLGACLICSCVIVLALAKWNKESPDTFDQIRRKFCCFCPTICFPQNVPDTRRKQRRNKSANKKRITTDVEGNLTDSMPKGMSASNESIDSIAVQNTVNSNAILLMRSDDEEEEDGEAACARAERRR